MRMCRGGGQENRGGRVRELEGQLEEVRSHYHHKLRSLENQLQVIACCYMAALPHWLAPHQRQAWPFAPSVASCFLFAEWPSFLLHKFCSLIVSWIDAHALY